MVDYNENTLEKRHIVEDSPRRVWFNKLTPLPTSAQAYPVPQSKDTA